MWGLTNALLTYMSIESEIGARVSEGRLILLRPLAPGTGMTRVLLMTEMVRDALDGPWSSTDDEDRFSRLRADLEHFATGRFIDPNYLKRMKKTEEVWTIRSVRPRPSLRVFGRFAMRDVLVATHHRDRKTLGGFISREWRREIRYCKAQWRTLFPSYEPLSGEDINDYVSNAADPSLFK